MTLPASDDFTRADGTDLGTNWTPVTGTFRITSNRACPNTNGDESCERWNADTFANNQYSQATWGGPSSGVASGVAVRCSSSAATYYGFYSDELNSYLFKVVAGTWTQLGSSATKFTNGDTIRIEAEGTAIRGLVNGTSRISVTDSSISSGAAGVCGYDDSTTTYLDGWSAGDISNGITVAPAVAAAIATAVAPTVRLGAITLTPAAASAAATAPNPTVSAGSAITVTPSAATVTATAIGPTVQAGNPVTVAPTAASIVATAVAPAVSLGAITVGPAAASIVATARGNVLLAACTAGVLAVDGTNARYLRNTAGIVFLSGFHTWYSAQDGGDTNPPAALDWDEYLDALIAHGCNYTKLWAMETARGWSDDENQWFAPHRYVRTGPGNAADGGLKFDLSQINPDYLDRLEQRAVAAGNAGMYVCVQLWQGWQVEIDKGGTGNPAQYHPYAAANNINSLDGDQDNDGDLSETHQDGANNVAWSYQLALVNAIIDRLNHLDNVIWEISNEDTASAGNTAWQTDLIDYIRTYETGKAKQHLIGMTVQWPSGSNATLDSSGADWVSYNGSKADAVHSASDPASMYDTDHTVGLTSSRTWIFEALCNGHGGAWYMDEWDGALYGTDVRANATYQAIRANLGYALDYAARLDLANATPQAGLSSTGYALAKTTGAAQILAYQGASGAFTVNLTAISGVFALEWLRTSTGTQQAGSNVNGGAVRTLTPPWSGEDVVALLTKLAESIEPAAAVATATATSPTVILGAIVIAPAAGSAAGSAIGPTVILGAVIVSPAAASSAAAATSPTVILGALTIAPATGSAAATAIAPTVILGAISITPTPATATATATSPDIQAGGAITLTPGAAAAIAIAIAPTIILGALTLAPTVASASASATNPTVEAGSAITVTPAAAGVAASAPAPTVILGAIVASPDPATAAATAPDPTVQAGGLSITPTAASMAATASDPAIVYGAIVIAVSLASAQATAIAPTLYFGASTITPAAASATATAPNPAIVIGIIVAAVTLTARRSFVLSARRSFTLTYRR